MSEFDFESAREWLSRKTNSFNTRKASLQLFDLLRYQERYEELIIWLEDMGFTVI